MACGQNLRFEHGPLPKTSFLARFERLQAAYGQNLRFEHGVLTQNVIFGQIRAITGGLRTKFTLWARAPYPKRHFWPDSSVYRRHVDKIYALSTGSLPKTSFLTRSGRFQAGCGQIFHFEHGVLTQNVIFDQIRAFSSRLWTNFPLWARNHYSKRHFWPF